MTFRPKSKYGSDLDDDRVARLIKHKCTGEEFENIFLLSKRGLPSHLDPGDVVVQTKKEKNIETHVALFVHGGEDRIYTLSEHGQVEECVDFTRFTKRTSKFHGYLTREFFPVFATTTLDPMLDGFFKFEWQRRAAFTVEITLGQRGAFENVSYGKRQMYRPGAVVNSRGRHNYREATNFWVGDELWIDFYEGCRLETVFYICGKKYCKLDHGLGSNAFGIMPVFTETFGLPARSFVEGVIYSSYWDPIAFLFFTVPVVEKHDVENILSRIKATSTIEFDFGIGSRIDVNCPVLLSASSKIELHNTLIYSDFMDLYQTYEWTSHPGLGCSREEKLEQFENFCPVTSLEKRWVCYHYQLVDICMVLHRLNLSVYVLLWITDWLPDLGLFSQKDRMKTIESVNKSLRRISSVRNNHELESCKTIRLLKTEKSV
jgi:hypothetical protein